MVRGVRLVARTAMVLIGAALGVMAVPSVVGASTHQAHHHAAAPKMVQESHAEFWECPAKTTDVLVGVNHLTLHPGQQLDITFVARNLAPTECNYVAPFASAGAVPASAATSPSLVVGPCGSMGFEIEGRHHHNEWPGVASFSCPAQGFAQVLPNGTVQGSGMWNQTEANGTTHFPSGHYTLLVDGHFSFPLYVDAH
jgi:hypothetical protein